MKQRLIRAVFPYGSKRKVLRGPASGMHFVVEPGMGFTYAIGTNAAAPRYFSRWIRPGMTVYDVGANKGQMALLFAKLVGPTGRVISLEPAPAEFACLQRNIDLNRLDRVRPLQLAAAETEGKLAFVYTAEHPTEGRLQAFEPDYASPVGSEISVRTLPLDDLLKDGPAPDFIKIDVEGAGAAVLRGARQILTQACPGVYLEPHNSSEMVAVTEELLTRGYVATTMTGEVVADPGLEWRGALWCYKPRPN